MTVRVKCPKCGHEEDLTESPSVGLLRCKSCRGQFSTADGSAEAMAKPARPASGSMRSSPVSLLRPAIRHPHGAEHSGGHLSGLPNFFPDLGRRSVDRRRRLDVICRLDGRLLGSSPMSP